MIIEIEELVNKNYHKLKETDLIIWKYISTHRKACCDYICKTKTLPKSIS